MSPGTGDLVGLVLAVLALGYLLVALLLPERF
ncbi:K+-transporting ATPase, KdpF subunit [Nocardioides scoriae]|uniref:K+-transporting ATPase, KdpF subunit n=1 Tax=Nocardioides scoriae TaxID=642780 RepID=A0A1H1LWH6_9ACTN|nr:potassium-transporting ATPase subunit F [Nocardioides scoriae]SDR78944.1 K+-transporting ATPase, KdpF subunit [Nocardioides scoriae]